MFFFASCFAGCVGIASGWMLAWAYGGAFDSLFFSFYFCGGFWRWEFFCGVDLRERVKRDWCMVGVRIYQVYMHLRKGREIW